MRTAWNRAKALAASTAIGLAFAGPAAAAELPSYATNVETIRGTITALTGKYTLTLADERGFSDSVTLRDGTSIQPSGVALEVGEPVIITGRASGATFLADEVDNDTSNDAGQSGGPYDYSDGGDSYAPYAPYDSPYPYGYGYGYFGVGFGIYGYPGYYCCYSGGGRRGPWHGRPGYPPGHGHPYPSQPLRISNPIMPRASVSMPHASSGGGRR